jgi:hypothetical protein
VFRLADLSSTHAPRVLPAHDPKSWTALPCPCAPPCACAHKAQWLAWNAREDAWYRPADLKRIEDTIDLQDPAVDGAELLLRCAPSLQRLREMSSAELAHIPPHGANHAMENWLWNGYMLAPSSAWSDTGLAGETNPPPVLTKGMKIKIKRKPSANPMKWVTFPTKSQSLPRAPDAIAKQLGLSWDKCHGGFVRVEVPLGQLLAAGARFVLPTFFDGLGHKPTRPLATEWRARPASEHRADEPWGNARDMIQDGPGLSEVLVDITQAGEMNAECLDYLQADWSTRPYLQRTAPR